jgi:uncharacterized protein (TIGR02271 family)
MSKSKSKAKSQYKAKPKPKPKLDTSGPVPASHLEAPAPASHREAPAPMRATEQVSVVRSEERLRTGIRTIPIERVRMQKVIVTEERTITVTVRREELRLVRDAIDHSTPDDDTPVERTPDSAHTMVLHEERIEVTRTVVPVERVTLVKETFSGEQTITGMIRKERVEVDHGSAPAPAV